MIRVNLFGIPQETVLKPYITKLPNSEFAQLT